MRARDIKVGQKYLARLDSSTERTLVVVCSKYPSRKYVGSGRCGYPSVNVVTRTVFAVRADEGSTLSTGVEAKDLFPA